MLQATYTDGPGGKLVVNDGALPKYWVEGANPPIIDQDTWRRVQDELARRRQYGGRTLTPSGGTCALTHRVVCSQCGRRFQQNPTRYWIFNMQGFAWASNYLDWYVYLPGICTLPGYGAHDAEPCTQRASYCTHPSLCIHRDHLWSVRERTLSAQTKLSTTPAMCSMYVETSITQHLASCYKMVLSSSEAKSGRD